MLSSCTAVKVNLKDKMTPVKHQGRRNTCSVFAATALMEYLIRKEENKEINLSENYNYWASKTYALDTDYVKVYKQIDALAGYLAVCGYKYGSMLESEWKYDRQNWESLKDKRCRTVDGKPAMENFTGIPPKNAEFSKYRIEPLFIDKENITDFILNEKKPVVFNVLWNNDAVDQKTGEMRMLNEEEVKNASGHVILLVGYDKESGKIIFRNSWGSKWGDNGYGTMPEEYIIKHYEVVRNEPFDQYDEEIREFMEICTKGISGNLILTD